MNHGRRTALILGFCSLLCLLACSGCPSAPPVIIDTTDVDGIIVDVTRHCGRHRSADGDGLPDGRKTHL